MWGGFFVFVFVVFNFPVSFEACFEFEYMVNVGKCSCR